MANRKLARLDIGSENLVKLENAGINTAKVN